MQYIAIYEEFGPLYGVGDTLEVALADAQRWSDAPLVLDPALLDDEADDPRDSGVLVEDARYREKQRSNSDMLWRHCTDRLVEATRQQVGGDIRYRVNEERLLDLDLP